MLQLVIHNHIFSLYRHPLFLLSITMLYDWEVVPIIVKEDLKYIAQYAGDGRQLVTEILVVKKLKLFVDNYGVEHKE